MSSNGNDHVGSVANIEADVEQACAALLTALRIDWRDDPQMHDTPRRMAKLYVREVFAGRYDPKPAMRAFPNTRHLDELYTIGPITIRSACSHHLVPTIGHAWIGVIPGDEVLGLSKFNRLAHWVFARPQIQEEATMQLADEIEAVLGPVGSCGGPRGLAVVVKAKHLCVSWRGVKDEASAMVTSVLRGTLKDSPEGRSEFFQLIRAQGFQA